MFHFKGSSQPHFNGYTLLLPADSVGHVGQLAIDMIINTLKAQKVATIYHRAIMPLVGKNAFSNTASDLTTSCEAFACERTKMVIIQIRSWLDKAGKKAFLNELVAWIKEQKFETVVLLSSSHAYERIDVQISDLLHRYLATPEAKNKYEFTFSCLGWKELEKRNVVAKNEAGSSDGIFIPGGGFTKLLYSMCCKENISMIVILRFASEGNNVGDALTLLENLNRWLCLVPKAVEGNAETKENWLMPSSWKHLFGNPPPEIF